MIKIVAKSVVKEGQEEKYLQLAKELIEKSRQESGCISYSIFQDMKNASIFTFIEEWENQEAIASHNNSEHFKKIVPLLGELRAGNAEVNLYKEV